jgi:phosphoribosyl-AMP cyclohydrolase
MRAIGNRARPPTLDLADARRYKEAAHVRSEAMDDWLDAVKWQPDGLVPAIAQDGDSGKVLTLAWMNREALALTVRTREAHYWSRSRHRLWRKGERSGHVQRVREIRLDCDGDALLVTVEQVGGIACHTGREVCFFRRLEQGRWEKIEPVRKDPEEIYGAR